MQTSGALRRENAGLCPMLDAVIASEAKQSIMPRGGLLRFARNDVDRPRRNGSAACAGYDDPDGKERVFARLEP
jgi:hypothetical protein